MEPDKDDKKPPASHGQIEPHIPKEVLARLAKALYPQPEEMEYTAEGQYCRHYNVTPDKQPASVGEGVLVKFQPHVVELLLSIDREDVATFREVLKLKRETIRYLGGKSQTELKSFDAAVEIVNSTKLAARILLVVFSACVTVATGTLAFAKWGWDAFWWVRGGKP